MRMLTDWLNIGVTLFLGLVGLYFAHNYRRQVRLALAEKRLQAYARLWELMEVASPVRERKGGKGPLTKDEREELHEKLTHWYYSQGSGILLEKEARELYLNAKHNLVCADNEIRPRDLNELIEDLPAGRGSLSMRQLSLLRSQMRADLRIFARWYYRGLSQADRVFLEYCGVDLSKKPWRASEAGPMTALPE